MSDTVTDSDSVEPSFTGTANQTHIEPKFGRQGPQNHRDIREKTKISNMFSFLGTSFVLLDTLLAGYVVAPRFDI